MKHWKQHASDQENNSHDTIISIPGRIDRVLYSFKYLPPTSSMNTKLTLRQLVAIIEP